MGQGGEAVEEILVVWLLNLLLLGLPLQGATLFTPCGLTTSLTEETGTVRGEGVGGGERGAAVEAGAVGCEGDGGAGGAGAAAGAGGAGVLCDGAGSVLLEDEQDTLSVFRSVELSKAGVSS